MAGPDRAQVPALNPATAPQALPSDTTTVRIAMTEVDTGDVIVASAGGVSAPEVSDARAVLFQPAGGNWNVSAGTSCAGPWTPVGSVTAAPTASPATAGDLLTLCAGGTQSTTLQGTVSAVYNSNGQSRAVNTLPLEEYVADVVPGESPSSWGTLGGPGPQDHPWGFQELEAQAVAVRSYVLSDLGGYGGYADTCDLTCQTYRGTRYLTPTTQAAAQDTAGQVMEMPTGRIATTEYSSSTGGYTSSAAEGSPFTPVPDTGDGVTGNSHHDWSTKVPLSVIAGFWGSHGSQPTVTVTAANRNGYGTTWGGRVTAVTISGGSTPTPTVVPVATFLADVDGTLGTVVQSNYFDITGQTSTTVQFVGHGWGHGIGMGQWGALGYAIGQDNAQGNWRYQQIVAHYYGPATLQSLPGGPTFGKPSGGVGGYWEVASDGGIFSFGTAQFHGSMGGHPLNQPVVGMAATPTGGGYWEVASDGGIFSFGAAAFQGSAAGTAGGPGTVALLPTRSGQGYLDVTEAGRATSFGDAPDLGDMSTAVPNYSGQVVAGATTPG